MFPVQVMLVPREEGSAVGDVGALATHCGPLTKAPASPGQLLDQETLALPPRNLLPDLLIQNLHFNKSPR